MLQRWLGGRRASLPADPRHAPHAGARCWNGKHRAPVTRTQFRRPLPELGGQQAKAAASFADLLFPKAALGRGVVLMKDLCSVGCLFEVVPAQTESRPAEFLEELHRRLMPLLRDAFPQDEHSPWIMQFFVQDRYRLDDCMSQLKQYIEPEVRASEYSRHWLENLRAHFRDACDESGFFVDPVDRIVWKGRSRSIRLCIWRIADPDSVPNTQSLDEVCERLSHSLAQVGIRLLARDADDLCRWLGSWFGPPEAAEPGAEEPLATTPLALLGEAVLGDIAHRALRYGAPWSAADRGCWYFQGRPHRFLTVNALLSEPEFGHLTAERTLGPRKQALWDRMPEGAVWTMAVAFAPQDNILEQVARVRRNSVGSDPQAMAVRALADTAAQQVSEGNLILPVFSGVFVSADDDEALERRVTELSAVLGAHGIALIPPKDDPLAQDSYVRALPFNFNPEQDRRFYMRRSRLWFADHMVRCLPLCGRSSGTRHPGVLAWNRGAEPLSFDPLNRMDRTKNAHMFVFGPTGSGKTAFLINTLLHAMAVHRPRLYLITALPTFGLLAEHFASKGLAVHHVHGDRTSIPPFAEARLLLDDEASEAATRRRNRAWRERT